MDTSQLLTTQRVYLPEEVYDTICVFGKFNDVVNKIIELFEDDSVSVDLENLPNYPVAKDKRHVVRVYNDWYAEMNEYYGERSHKYSLRRMLCYFVYEEFYNDYDISTGPTTTHFERVYRRIATDLQVLKQSQNKDKFYIDESLWDALFSSLEAIRRSYADQIQQFK